MNAMNEQESIWIGLFVIMLVVLLVVVYSTFKYLMKNLTELNEEQRQEAKEREKDSKQREIVLRETLLENTKNMTCISDTLQKVSDNIEKQGDEHSAAIVAINNNLTSLTNTVDGHSKLLNVVIQKENQREMREMNRYENKN